MSEKDDQIVQRRIAKSNEAFSMAELAVEKGFFLSAVSRMYYSCFYLVTASLLRLGYKPSTHAGVKGMFGLHLINSGKLDKKWAKLYTTLFDRRHESDYSDFFIITEAEVSELIAETKVFRQALINNLNDKQIQG